VTGDVVREDLDAEAYQRRDVFAHYGAAMFYAQVLEQGLVNALTFAQTATNQTGTQQLLDFNFSANLSVPMGRLLHRLKPFLGDDTELATALTGALELRNRFAHSFWVEHDKSFFSFAGREIMLADSIEAQETFQAVDQRLTPVLERYLHSLGITPKQHAATVAEAMDQMQREAEARDE
jgi:hypothetical protein